MLFLPNDEIKIEDKKENIYDKAKIRKINDYFELNSDVFHYQIMNNLNFSNHVVVCYLDVILSNDYIQSFLFNEHQLYFQI